MWSRGANLRGGWFFRAGNVSPASQTAEQGAVPAAAREVRDRLAEIGLQSFSRLSGGKWVHVVLPVAPVHGWEQAREQRLPEA